MPTRLDLKEEEVISISSNSDYVPPEPVYEPGSSRPEPIEKTPEDPKAGPSREEGTVAPNIFTDSDRGREMEPPREGPGAPYNFTDSARSSEREPPREEGPGASNDFNDTARARVRERGRGFPGIPVQHVAPFFRGSGNRRNFLGRVRPM